MMEGRSEDKWVALRELSGMMAQCYILTEVIVL
jgi:hypothetical protein